MKTFKEFKNEIKLQNTSLDRHRKLSDNDITNIKKMFTEGAKISVIAESYSVSTKTISYHLNPISRAVNAAKQRKYYHLNSPDKNREIARRKRESRNKYIEELYNAYVNNVK